MFVVAFMKFFLSNYIICNPCFYQQLTIFNINEEFDLAKNI